MLVPARVEGINTTHRGRATYHGRVVQISNVEVEEDIVTIFFQPNEGTIRKPKPQDFLLAPVAYPINKMLRRTKTMSFKEQFKKDFVDDAHVNKVILQAQSDKVGRRSS